MCCALLHCTALAKNIYHAALTEIDRLDKTTRVSETLRVPENYGESRVYEQVNFLTGRRSAT